MRHRTYAGIGSRRTPPETLALMRDSAHRLAEMGWMLRTGGAPGADQAFHAGAAEARGDVELHLPWPTFEHVALAQFAPATLTVPRAGHAAYDTQSEFWFSASPVGSDSAYDFAPDGCTCVELSARTGDPGKRIGRLANVT